MTRRNEDLEWVILCALADAGQPLTDLQITEKSRVFSEVGMATILAAADRLVRDGLARSAHRRSGLRSSPEIRYEATGLGCTVVDQQRQGGRR